MSRTVVDYNSVDDYPDTNTEYGCLEPLLHYKSTTYVAASAIPFEPAIAFSVLTRA
eukprot:SAG31_NODE_28624_length_407_cov_1.142857_1_plen_55_part_01